ncbi:hypothetical protein ALC60_01785, partial [Trachymyrmex zeteki]
FHQKESDTQARCDTSQITVCVYKCSAVIRRENRVSLFRTYISQRIKAVAVSFELALKLAFDPPRFAQNNHNDDDEDKVENEDEDEDEDDGQRRWCSWSRSDRIGRWYDFDFRYSKSIFFVCRDEIEADCEFTNIRVVASKKKGLRIKMVENIAHVLDIFIPCEECPISYYMSFRGRESASHFGNRNLIYWKPAAYRRILYLPTPGLIKALSAGTTGTTGTPVRNDARNHGNIEKWSSSSSIWRAGPDQEAREKPPLVFLLISSSSCVNKNNALGLASDPVPDAGSRRSIHAVVIASGNEYRLSAKKGREEEVVAVSIPNLEI